MMLMPLCEQMDAEMLILMRESFVLSPSYSFICGSFGNGY